MKLKVSSIFTKRTTAEELADLVLSLTRIFEPIPNLKAVVHRGREEFEGQYAENTLLKLEHSQGLLIARLEPVNNKVSSGTIFINLKEIASSTRIPGWCEIFNDIELHCTVTNIFLFSLLHEIGHYTHYLTLASHGILKQASDLEDLVSYFFSNDEAITSMMSEVGYNPVYRYLSFEENYADNYALRNIHKVRRQLKILDKINLTCLDSEVLSDGLD